MKKVIIFCVFLTPALIYGQSLDSLFFKTGKIATGYFTFFEDKSFVFYSNDDAKKLYANTIDKFVKKGKTYLPVEIFVGGVSKIFLAEKVFSGEISILEFDALKAATRDDYNTNEFKYYFLKDKKITPISWQNLDAFYKVYLGDCYKSSENKNLDNRYNSIVSVLNNYYNCKDPKQKKITKRKYVEGYALGFGVGLGSLKVIPSISERHPSGEIINYFRNANIKGNSQIFASYFKLDLVKNRSIYLQSFFQTQKVASQDTFFVSSDTYQLYLPGIIDPFLNTDILSYYADYNINMLGVTALIEQNFNIRRLKVGGVFGFSVAKTAKYTDCSTIYIKSTVPHSKAVNTARLFDFKDNASLNITYGFNFRFKIEYPITSTISLFSNIEHIRTVTKATHFESLQGNYNTNWLGASIGLNYYLKNKKS
jgi:hypothetical protein